MKKARVKILHVTFNMGIGGTEQVICQIIKNSDSDKYVHEILCIDGTVGPLGLALKGKGVYIEAVKRRPGVDLKLIRFVRSLLRRRDIDVVHCHQYTPYFYGAVAALNAGVKVIFTEHGRFYPDKHNLKRRFINPLLEIITDNVTAISESTADAVAKYEYIPRRKILTIYNGINDLKAQRQDRRQLVEELGLSCEHRYIGTISRLEPIKNQHMMIDAFDKVKRLVPDMRLVIIGDGAKMSDLKNHAGKLGLEKDIIFTGFLDDPQRFMVLFEVFLLSSFSEGASMTLLEAMSLSIPCVVTDVGGNPEIVQDGVTGALVPSDDSEEFSASIIQLVNDECLRLRYGEAGRKRFLEMFTVEKMVKSYQLLYSV